MFQSHCRSQRWVLVWPSATGRRSTLVSAMFARQLIIASRSTLSMKLLDINSYIISRCAIGYTVMLCTTRLSRNNIDKRQRVQNASARVVKVRSKYDRSCNTFRALFSEKTSTIDRYSYSLTFKAITWRLPGFMGGSSGGEGEAAPVPWPGPPVIVHEFIKCPFVFRLKFCKGGK